MMKRLDELLQTHAQRQQNAKPREQEGAKRRGDLEHGSAELQSPGHGPGLADGEGELSFKAAVLSLSDTRHPSLDSRQTRFFG